jgi:hypothetical protein
VAPAVERYLDFAAATQERLHKANRRGEPAKQGGAAVAPVMTVGHGYTAVGLRRLADALAAVQGDSATQIAQRLRSDAEELQKNPKSLRHADIVRNVFDQVANAVGRSVPDEGRRLQALASAIDATRPLLSQQDTVQEFFVAAADAVRDMTLPS